MALSLQGVTVRLGPATVLREVTATWVPGRVTAIVGPNGAGKSTLLRAAAALVRADGRIHIDGADVTAMNPRARARAIGYLPQDAGVQWNMRVADVVALGRHPHASSPAQDMAAVERALDATATAGFAHRPIATLSGGERARVLLARVLAGEPRFLLCDEPLASLDPAHAADIVARLRAAAAAGAGVAVVAHDLLQAQVLADDAILLVGGQVVADGPAAAVLTPEHLGPAFGIRFAALDAGERRLWAPIGR